MARPSKPAAVLESEKRSHRTKAELAQREKSETALLSGLKCFERESVKANPVADKEYKRIIKLMRAIGKDDALYAPEYNRYAELFAEEEFYKREISELQGELVSLRALTVNASAAADKISAEIETGNVCEQLCALLGELLENIDKLHDRRGKLLKQLSDLDLKVKQKREAMLALEKENCMTVSAALRTIPKEVQKPEEDALLKALRED